MKNYGVNLVKEKAEQSEKDWQFGASSLSCLAEIPEDVREHYLPKGERQNIGSEKMDCASRGPLNILEAKLSWLYLNDKMKNADWFEKNGYITSNGVELSDAFVAINSGTTAQGNSLKAPLEAIRKQGVIPKAMLPQVESFEDYYNPARITPEMKKLGLDFVDRFTVNYEKVTEKDYAALLTKDLLDVAGYAWMPEENGEYPSSDYQPNHCFIIFKTPRYFAFDNYLDEGDGDYIKKLASNFNFYDYGYRLFITSETDPVEIEKKTLWQSILKNIQKVIGLMGLNIQLIKKNIEEMPKPEPVPEIKPEPEKPIYEWDTPVKARHSCRVIMDLYGLSWANKDLLCAVIQAESGFNPNAIHDNGTSKDFGIAQINSFFWIGEGKQFESAEEVLEKPELSIHFMCKMFLAGKLTLWTAFKNGSYKKFLLA